jgi:hypothetical protein
MLRNVTRGLGLEQFLGMIQANENGQLLHHEELHNLYS